jgi:ABC-type transport system involved in multi-copper enzyme maturation permease subunit
MGLLRADLYKLVRHPLFGWTAAILLGLVVLRGLIWPPNPDLPWAGLWSFDLIALALVILTALLTGLEFSENTFRSLVSRGVPRWGLVLSKFVALILAGGLLLLVVEGLATLLGVRPALNWGELGRAWLALWPYASLIALLTVLSRNGGLALIIGVIWIPLELAVAAVMGPFAMLSNILAVQFLAPDGALGSLYRWTLAFNSANWIYLGDPLRAPNPTNLQLWAMPRPVLFSALVLAGYLVLGLGLSVVVVYRRDVTEVAQAKKRQHGLSRRRARPEGAQGLPQREKLPIWTGSGPILFRLVRTHLFKMNRTALLKISVAVSLLFPLALWGIAKALSSAGFQDIIYGSGPEGSGPLVMSVSLLVVSPLATVIGALAVSNELTLGTRRAELTRAVTRLQTIVGQSVALVLAIGAMFAIVMAVTLILGAETSGTWQIGSAAQVVLIASLAAGAYVGVVQIGGALTRSPLGATAFGLGFLLADWFAILTPTATVGGPGVLPNLGRYTVVANMFAIANQGEIAGVGIKWQSFGVPAAILLLGGYAVGSHALAVLIARWRDAG